jgi:hypothetical protein
VSTGLNLGGALVAGPLNDAIPNLTAYDFWLRSYNPSTGISTLEGFTGEVFEQGADDALRSLKILRVSTKVLSQIGNVAGYSTAFAELVEGNYSSAGVEAASATTGVLIGAKRGALPGAAWGLGWEGGRYFTNHSESYNRAVFGIYSDIYIQRALTFKWDVELNSTQIHLATHRNLLGN